jgi:hypothetical protein
LHPLAHHISTKTTELQTTFRDVEHFNDVVRAKTVWRRNTCRFAGGASGGAIKDLGVFGRGETVYTVYISMTDIDGGGTWPMQYALLGAVPAGANALVTPPFAEKKVRAEAQKLPPSGRQVFVHGVISEQGKIGSLAALQGIPEPLAKAAIDSLQQWQFLPAQLNGKPVAVKVLVGVMLMPTTNGH